MNEIKIKFWNPLKKIMEEPVFNIKDLMKGRVFTREEIENLIPLLFTGLKDKNGIEIYEGDILKYGTAEIFWSELISGFAKRFHNKKWQRVRIENNPKYKFQGFEPLQCNKYIDEVIGNIYQDKEMEK